ncbi:hypothetical protein H6P81_015895 [Aristolochia fimbriata]|uniref:BTB domain-containing protein n=1 Tax=Aristolochia fimbriata TaxID=158543 RepID=A0AAV7E6V2_ARIFI|nr:hypothetical protein H6P81_015895 [Aristolochia fimbriata]
MDTQYTKPRSFADVGMKMGDNDRTRGELRALDCNLSSLCEHIQVEGFDSGVFSDVLVNAMGSTYRLHRLILSRSSYFRNMLHGPWKEANAPVLTLHIDDDNVNEEAVTTCLAYLYGHHPKLNDSNAFRVLAAASFLDLQDLCVICTDFIVAELWTSNFLAYQIFAESQDYGIHGERVRNACWGYLCQSGTMELREVLPKLSSQTLHALLTSDELWVPNEEKRFELTLHVLLAKGALLKADHLEEATSTSEAGRSVHDTSQTMPKLVINESTDKKLIEDEVGSMTLQDMQKTAHNILVELADCVVDFHAGVSDTKSLQRDVYSQQILNRCSCKTERSSSMNNSFPNSHSIGKSCSFIDMENRSECNAAAMEGPSDESSLYHLSNKNNMNSIWVCSEQSRGCSSSSTTEVAHNDWGRCSMAAPTWGGRIVSKKPEKNHAKSNFGIHSEEYDTFVNIFEGGSLLYCNMSFEALLNVREQLEELGFPCKAVNDGLWLQTLLSYRVQEIGAETCKNCCLMNMACSCRHSYGFSHGASNSTYYRQDQERSNQPGNIENVYLAETQGDGNGLFGPVRVHVRGPIDGLVGIGRGTTFMPASAWPPTRFVFSRVPFGLGSRNYPQSIATEESEARADPNGDLPGDGLPGLVGLGQGSNGASIHAEQRERAFGSDMQGRLASASASVPSSTGIPVQMLEAQEHGLGLEWDSVESSSITLDMKTPLRRFPPFRFGVEFEDVHRLTDGQVMHSPEVFYAGSLWKVSVQAFNDEDPQGRRTLGLFLHRRKAELTDSLRKAHMYVDTREKVTARYQLICPCKREVMVFGSFKQTGTLWGLAGSGCCTTSVMFLRHLVSWTTMRIVPELIYNNLRHEFL